jgi:hypothetical protein
MKRKKPWVFKVITLFFITSVLCGCITSPFVEDYNEKDSGFDMTINLTNVSEDEYNYVITHLTENYSYQLTDKKYDSPNAFLSYHLTNYSGMNKLLKDISNLKTIYGETKEMENLFSHQKSTRQYVFSKESSASTSAKYSISVIFDPSSDVIIGGYPTKTDSNGRANFIGIGLDLDQATEGIIYIIDSFDNKVLAQQYEDGSWIVEARGETLGEKVSKLIEVEAFK